MLPRNKNTSNNLDAVKFILRKNTRSRNLQLKQELEEK